MRLVQKAILGSVSMFALAAPAFAQDAPPANGDEGVSTEIIVQARRRDESIQDVPQVVNAVTAQELQKLNIRDLKDVTSVVPGLALQPGSNGIGGVATLRGVAFDVNASGNNGTVEFYMNDSPISAQVVLQSMYDIGQIEVLRGPQGTLRGRASPSGSITITSRKPDLDDIGGMFNSTVNNIGGVNGQAALNLPVIPGMLAVRVAGLVDNNDVNRVHSVTSPGVDPEARTWSGRVAVRFAPTDSIDILGTYQTFHNHATYFDQVESQNFAVSTLGASPVAIAPSDRLSVEDLPRDFTQDYKIYNLQAEWRFAGLKLNYVGNWTRTKTITRDPNDKGNYFGTAFGGSVSAANNPFATTFGTAANFQNAAQFTNSRSQQDTHEVRLSSDERLFGMVDFVIGGMVNKLSPPFELWAQTPLFVNWLGDFKATPTLVGMSVPVAPGVSIPGFLGYNNAMITQENTKSTEKSLFGNITVHLGEATEVSGGLRYIDYKAHSEKWQTTASQAGLSKVGLGVQINDHFTPTIYSFSLKHRFNDNLMVYASTGSSWRASAQTNGIIDRDDVYPWGTMAGLLHLAPETSKSYEIGLKSNWLDRRLMFNVTYYHQDYKNYFFSSSAVQVAQRTAIPTGGSKTGPNAGDTYTLAVMSPALAVDVPVKVDGVEADFSFQATDNLSLGGSVSYSMAKIKNGSVPCNLSPLPTTAAQLVAATGGQQVAMCSVNYRAGIDAPFSANFQAEYNAPLTDNMSGFIRTLVTYKGDSQNNPSNALDDIKAYAQVNLFLGLRGGEGAWELAAYAKNLFDTQRVLSRDANPIVASAQFLAPTFANLGGFPQATTYRGINMTPPRELGVNLRVSFGSR